MQARCLALERPRFSLVDGILFHEDPGLPGRLQLVVPRQVQEQLVQESHDGRFSVHFAENAPGKLSDGVSVGRLCKVISTSVAIPE